MKSNNDPYEVFTTTIYHAPLFPPLSLNSGLFDRFQ